ncbi:hypothetical protein [Oleiharenicola sp. Vm1]|uniref:hypothetical protein n=1 Tax=Oleiharenicola sp. Vm1 TaxID=3398393 RepID=UPI0039F4CA7C
MNNILMKEIFIGFGVLGAVASLFVIFRGLKRPIGRFSFTELLIRERSSGQQSGAQIIGEGILGAVCSGVLIILSMLYLK